MGKSGTADTAKKPGNKPESRRGSRGKSRGDNETYTSNTGTAVPASPLEIAREAIKRGDGKGAQKAAREAHTGYTVDGSKVTRMRPAKPTEIKQAIERVSLETNADGVARKLSIADAELMLSIGDDLGFEGATESGQHVKAKWSPVLGPEVTDTTAVEAEAAGNPALAAKLNAFRTILDVAAVKKAAETDPELAELLAGHTARREGARKLTVELG